MSWYTHVPGSIAVYDGWAGSTVPSYATTIEQKCGQFCFPCLNKHTGTAAYSSLECGQIDIAVHVPSACVSVKGMQLLQQ